MGHAGDQTQVHRPMALVGCAALSGVLYALAFMPYGHPALAWVALAPLVVAAAHTGPLAGAGLGLIFVVSAGSSLGPWLPGMLQQFFGMSAPEAMAASLGVVLLCGCPFLAFGAVVSWSARRGVIGPGVVALTWGACEMVRTYGAVQAPWGLLAYSQADWLRILQAADLVGPIGIGMLVAAVGASVAGLLSGAARSPGFARSAAVVVVVFLAFWVYGGHRLQQEIADGDAVHVAVVQGAVSGERRFKPEFRGENLDRYLGLTASLGSEAQLVAWPEFALDFHAAAEPALWQKVADLSAARGGDLLVGAPHSRRRLLLREELNSALLVRGGRVVDRHDKVALMPFSEVQPGGLPLGTNRYRPGLELRPLASGVGSVGVVLCSEALHPEIVRRLVEKGAELLVNPSNDDWFDSEAATHHQVAVARFRAIENRRPMLRPSTSGRSVIIDVHGRILAAAPFGEAAVVQATVRGSRGTTVYGRIAALVPRPVPSLAFVPLLYVAAARRRSM